MLDVVRRRARLGLLVLCCFSLGCEKRATVKPSPDPRATVEVVLPEVGAYTGAFIEFGEAEDAVALETIEDFEQMVGKHQAIIASSSYWGEQSFPSANLQMIWRHGSLPLVFWSPWDRPYEQKRGPDRFGLNAILAGTWNRYIDDWADAAREFGHPLIVSFGNEMNGDWFPWSGVYYGGGKPIASRPNEWEGPELFKRAYRYVVDRVRARSARNIQWMFQKSKILDSRILDSKIAASQASSTGQNDGASYLELVVSSSKGLLEMGRAEIIELALKELTEFFPAAAYAKLVKATVIKEVHATFAPSPLSDQFRCSPVSPWPRLFLSGDWTATGWPATMEGAVRGGYQTAEALCRAAGDQRKFIIPDLRPRGLMRLFRP
jgi:hypothetical protein